MEPMEVLHEIVAADRQARKAYEKAQDQSLAFDSNLDILRRKLENQAMRRAKGEVEDARKQALVDARSAMDGLEEQYRSQLAALTERYQARREDTVERMFRLVVGLDD